MEKYVLYILMRNDMDSLTPGKAMAQAAHAANRFTWELENSGSDFPPEFMEWLQEGYGFGTTIVLSVNNAELHWYTCACWDKYITGIIKDETYPLVDGDTLHTFPVETCGYVFAPQGSTILSSLNLYGAEGGHIEGIH